MSTLIVLALVTFASAVAYEVGRAREAAEAAPRFQAQLQLAAAAREEARRQARREMGQEVLSQLGRDWAQGVQLDRPPTIDLRGES